MTYPSRTSLRWSLSTCWRSKVEFSRISRCDCATGCPRLWRFPTPCPACTYTRPTGRNSVVHRHWIALSLWRKPTVNEQNKQVCYSYITCRWVRFTNIFKNKNPFIKYVTQRIMCLAYTVCRLRSSKRGQKIRYP